LFFNHIKEFTMSITMKKVATAALIGAITFGAAACSTKPKEECKQERNGCKGKHGCKGKNKCKSAKSDVKKEATKAAAKAAVKKEAAAPAAAAKDAAKKEAAKN
jgi:hypothetical protein